VAKSTKLQNPISVIIDHCVRYALLDNMLAFASLYDYKLKDQQLFDVVRIAYEDKNPHHEVDALEERKYFRSTLKLWKDDLAKIFELYPKTRRYLTAIVQAIANHCSPLSDGFIFIELGTAKQQPKLRRLFVEEAIACSRDETLSEYLQHVEDILVGLPKDLLEAYLAEAIDKVEPDAVEKALEAIGRKLTETEITDLTREAINNGYVKDLLKVCELRAKPLTHEEKALFIQIHMDEPSPNHSIEWEDVFNLITYTGHKLSEKQLESLVKMIPKKKDI
jgi:hypothetical protein